MERYAAQSSSIAIYSALLHSERGYAYDTMPEFDPDGTILGNLIKQFQNRIINVAFLQITPETKKMEEHFQQTYNLHSKSYKIHHQ